MALISRRAVVAAGATLPVGLVARKSHDEDLPALAKALDLTDPPVAAPDVAFLPTPRSITCRSSSDMAW